MISILEFSLVFTVSTLTFCSSLNLTQSCSGYECLQQYVYRFDPAYSWKDTGSRLHGTDPLHLTGWDGYVLNMTSQTWLTPSDTDRHEWWHILVVVVPKQLKHTDTAFMWITGGHNDDDFNPEAREEDIFIVGDFAVATGIVGAALFQVPNQNMVFSSDPEGKSRSEDGIIAFTWHHFINDPTSQAEWLLRLPMTKAGVRGLDTVAAFLTSDTAPQEVQDLGLHPTNFIVAGASKRGWTTWTVGAVDHRVMAIAPVVMDELNFVENIKHHWRSYGGWSFALEDYWTMGITVHLENPKLQQMLDIVEPYEFRDKLMMPKLVINAANDEFFLPDDTAYWWDDMPEANKLNRFLMAPNSEHSLATGILELLPAITTWARELLTAYSTLKEKIGGRTLIETLDDRAAASLELMEQALVPRFNWTIQSNGDIVVKAMDSPISVHMWHATTCNDLRRDFRIVNLDSPCRCGIPVDGMCGNLRVVWTPQELQETHPGSLTWVAHRQPPPDGKWTAFFVDLKFNGPKPGHGPIAGHGWPFGRDGTFQFTTTVSVVPNTFRFDDCQGQDCMGELL